MLAYRLKYSFPRLYGLLERLAFLATGVRFSHRVRSLLPNAKIQGQVYGLEATMRPLVVDDALALHGFLQALPASHLDYFKPHRFDLPGLESVIQSRAILTYGLFIDGRISAYALIKITPAGTAFAGSLVAVEWTGRGIGKWLSQYMYWQARQGGFVCRATISKSNMASFGAYTNGRDYRVVKDLPNDYQLLEFPPMPRDSIAPDLQIG